MKNLLTMLALFMTLNVSASTEIYKQIIKNKPGINTEYAEALSHVFAKACKEYKLPCHVIVAISFVESSYVVEAINARTKDYGLMQVNRWHVSRSKLDKDRLLTDAAYNVKQGIRIFALFYKTYGLNEGVMRYNCGTRPKCIKHRRVKYYLNKVRRAM